MTDVLSRFAPGQAGAIVLGAVIAFLLLGDHRRLLSRRNLGLVALFPLALVLFDILDLPANRQALALDGMFLLTAGMAAWALYLSRRPWADWSTPLPLPALRTVTALVLVATASVTFTRPPDDAGHYTNLGAQRWVETGTLPYGDDLLKGPDAPAFGAAATYGPVMYLVHIPFQALLGAEGNPADADPGDPSYRWPPVAASQAATFATFLVGLWAFFLIVRRYTEPRLAWASVAVLASLPYFVGLGGRDEVIGGLRFASHVIPVSASLLAFLALSRPVWAGGLLAVAAGALYYPAFFFPVWGAWYLFRSRSDALRFTLGFAAVGLVIAVGVVVFTRAGPGESALRMFLESTLEHQEGANPLEYGASSFSFWTHHPGLAELLQRPLFGSSSLFKGMFLAFLGFCGAAALLARGRTPVQLAALTAAVAAAVQLWKTHATGSYVEWYLPFLLVALVAQRRSGPDPAPDGEPA